MNTQLQAIVRLVLSISILALAVTLFFVPYDPRTLHALAGGVIGGGIVNLVHTALRMYAE